MLPSPRKDFAVTSLLPGHEVDGPQWCPSNWCTRLFSWVVLLFFPSNAFMASARSFNTLYGIAKALISKLTRKAVCWLRATKENWWRTSNKPSSSRTDQTKQRQTTKTTQKQKRKPTHKREMTGYQFIGRFMEEVTTLCHLIMVWPQTQKREEHQQTQGHTRRWERQHSTMRKPGIPPARIPEITRRMQKRYNDSPIVSFEANNDNAASQREWWKEEWDGQWNKSYREKELSETDSETALRMRSESAQ